MTVSKQIPHSKPHALMPCRMLLLYKCQVIVFCIVMDDKTLVPLDFTYVVYDSASLRSQALAYFTFLPMVLIISHATVVVFRRELETLYFFAGVVVNSAVSVFSKRIIKQPRPASSVKTGYGMPSHHTQYMAFFTCFLLLQLARRRIKFQNPLTRIVLSAAALISTAVVSLSRVELGVHTQAQVLVGLAMGAVLGVVWYGLGGLIRPFFPVVENFRLARMLGIRDSSHIDNVLMFEYRATRAQRHASKRKE